jgi:hypothetical protein
MPDPGPGSRDWSRYFALGQVGTEMVVPIVVGLLLDYKLGWAPVLTIIGAVAGFVGGLAHLLVMLNRKDDRPSERESR